MFIDANLLVLLVVGLADTRLIRKHKRLRAFNLDDFKVLVELVGGLARILVTPNTLTEVSNLLSQHREPQRSVIMDKLACLVTESEEIYIISAEACRNKQFRRLGLTDAALLDCISANRPLIAVDADLYRQAFLKGSRACLNFHHIRLR